MNYAVAGWFAYAFTTPFLIVGLLLGYFGLRALLRIVVRGSWQLEVPDGGGVLGQPLSATLFPTRARRPVAAMTCDRPHHPRLGAQQHRDAVGNDVDGPCSDVDPATDGSRTGAPAADHGEPTRIDRTGSGVQWQLNVVVPLHDGYEEPVFDVPVCTWLSAYASR